MHLQNSGFGFLNELMNEKKRVPCVEKEEEDENERDFFDLPLRCKIALVPFC